jgi:hypothetical protein
VVIHPSTATAELNAAGNRVELVKVVRYYYWIFMKKFQVANGVFFLLFLQELFRRGATSSPKETGAPSPKKPKT